MSYAIKVRMIGKKKWSFLTRRGTNPLRVHAVQFATPEKAQTLIDESRQENPEWEWKIVDFRSGKSVRAATGARMQQTSEMVEPVVKTLITKRLL